MVPEGWERRRLNELCCKAISYGIVQTGEKDSGSVPCVRVVDLAKPQIEPSDLITTTEAISRSYKKTILEVEEIMFALRGEIGLVRLVSEGLAGCNLTRGIARIAADRSQILPSYLLRQIQSESFRKDLFRRVNGSALQEIPLGELRRIQVAVAPLPEQRKIAEILSTWDQAIEKTESLLANARTQKRALMQNLLTGKRRFPEFEGQPWKEVRLGDVLDIQYGKSPKDVRDDEGQIPIVGTGGVTGFCHEGFASGPAIVLGRKGTIDTPQWVEGSFWPIDTTYFCSADDNTSLRWVFYLLSFMNLRRYNEASGVPSLSRETLRSIRIRLPSLPEQEKIARAIGHEEVFEEIFRRDAAELRTEKKALMQQLLTGKRRVSI